MLNGFQNSLYHSISIMEIKKNKSVLDKVILVSLIVLNTVFLVYWGMLAYYSQLHYDDLHFLWKMREMSVFEFVKSFYYSRSGRFVVYGIDAIVSVITDKLGFHQLWSILYYVLGVGLCWLVVKEEKVGLSKFGLLMCTMFFYNLYVLTNIDFPVFYYLCAMMYYLSLPAALVVLKYLSKPSLSWKQWVVFMLSILFLGGAFETFTPIVLLAMFFMGMHYWHEKNWNVCATWSMPQVKRIVWTALVLLVLLIVVVAAPGNYVRMNESPEIVHPSGAIGWLKAVANAVVMFFYFMAFYLPYYLVVFVLAYYVGAKANILLPKTKSKMAIGFAIAFVVYLIISSLPDVYLYGGFGVQRLYTHVVFALMLTVVAIGFIMGDGKKFTKSGWCAVGGIAVLVVIMSMNIFNDAPSARAYGTAVDERIGYLCSLRDEGQKNMVVVSPLPVPYTEDPKHLVFHLMGKNSPQPVLYYISETDTIPNEYEYHMKRVLNLDFDFVLGSNEKQE